MMESHRISVSFCSCAGRHGLPVLCLQPGIFHAWLHFQNALNPFAAGQRLVNRDNHRGQLHQLNDQLRHIIVQGHYVPLMDRPQIHPERALMNQKNCSGVNDHIGRRIHQCRQFSHKLIHLGQGFIPGIKLLHLFFFLAESPNDTDTGKIFPCGAQQSIQGGL